MRCIDHLHIPTLKIEQSYVHRKCLEYSMYGPDSFKMCVSPYMSLISTTHYLYQHVCFGISGEGIKILICEAYKNHVCFGKVSIGLRSPTNEGISNPLGDLGLGI